MSARGFYGTYSVRVEANGTATVHTADISKGVKNLIVIEH